MIKEGPGLVGRRGECELLGRLVESVRGGWSAVLAIRGEPGLGKTALLDYAAGMADGLLVVRVACAEAETDLAFAAVERLCAPMLDHLAELPDPQRDALAVALGLAAGNAPDQFMAGLALLGLLSSAAKRQPVLCVVDDAQWLDRSSARALAFAARRLQADPVAMVLATQERADEFSWLPELPLKGLSYAAARELLSSVIGARGLASHTRDQFIAETGGNPLALLELSGGLPAAPTGFGIPDTSGLPGQLERSFVERYRTLPEDTRRLLLSAAADPTGDPALLWMAAKEQGIAPAAAAAAEDDGLVRFGPGVTFRHPLVRSAVYRAAAPAERRAVHQALANVIDAEAHPARRAWHRAQAAPGPDEDVATELEHEAARARIIGGAAAAAAFLERAATLTLDPGRRSARALAAAQARQRAGAADAALELLHAAEAGSLTEREQAEATLLRGRISYALNYGRDAPPLLLKAARQFEPLDPVRARETYLEALSAALHAGRLGTVVSLPQVAAAARAAPPAPRPVRPSDLLLDAVAVLITEGHAAAAVPLRQTVDAFLAAAPAGEEDLRWSWLAGHAAGLAWDYESWDLLSERTVRLAHDTGTLMALPVTLNARAAGCLLAGDLERAASLAAEEAEVSHATGGRTSLYAALGLAAYQGRETDAAGLLESATTGAISRGEGIGLTIIQWAAALLYNGLGRYAEALDWAGQASEDSTAQRYTRWALAELVEAAARAGDPAVAAVALRRLSESTTAGRTDWSLGIGARSRALLSDGNEAERLYREAIERLGRTVLRPDLARSHLLYGEWLRRERRRLDARDQLRHAYGMFADIGMEAFAERARTELHATGERARKRVPETRTDLTPQEAQIARRAAEGATNAEIAARLFISESTVDYHLRKVFRKLTVTSRRQLAPLLSARA